MFKKNTFTFFALLFSSVYFLLVTIFDLDIFESIISMLSYLEHAEIDEFIIPLVVISIALLLDSLRRSRNDATEIEKNKIYKAMMSSVYHVMNNFLNQMQLFKMTADMTPGFDSKVLDLYDIVIEDAQTQLQALATITKLDEETIKKSVAPVSHENPNA